MRFSSPGLEPGFLNRKTILFFLFFGLIFFIALYLRMSGLFRGLGSPASIFHPDEAKQVLALFNFLNGDYVRYYGSLFYDGYPYGLNHLDEYLLRPLLSFLGAEIPDHFPLYYYARLLRVVYGMITVVIAYRMVSLLFHSRSIGLFAMFLLAISPLSVTVTHFATGDIGVDLFTALCFLFLFYYSESNKKNTWLFLSGVAVGAAFSAKYNGMLLGMAPGFVLCLEFLHWKDFRIFAQRCFLLATGILAGILLFTPNLVLDFKPALNNIIANFHFIKNYNVPAEIVSKPWIEKAILGIKNNSLYIFSSLGNIAFLTSFIGLLFAVKQYTSGLRPQMDTRRSQLILILSIGTLPVFTLLISLCGKYTVQPFHFSSLQLPIVIMICYLISYCKESPSKLLRTGSLILIALTTIEFGRVSWQENFFWRLEDNLFHEQNLPASLYDAEAFYTHRSGIIRSLFLEPSGSSVFRNRKLVAKGPDANLWNTIQVAPLPQVPNPVGSNWIFLNGPTFPRNEKMLHIHGEAHGQTIQRYLVLPAVNNWPLLGLRSGSFPTEVSINFGEVTTTVKLDAHQQKILALEPKNWRISEDGERGEKIFIIPLEASVPHDDIWLTILTSQTEKEYFTLFGGGQDTSPTIPRQIPVELEEDYFDALSRIRFLDLSLSWRVQDGNRIPMWEVPIPSGRYILITEVDGLIDNSEITIEFEDAVNGKLKLPEQSFSIKKGIQRIEYHFTKPFAPYQGRFVISSISGKCQILSFKLIPDYTKISDDFDIWRKNDIVPEWVTRFRK